MNISSNVQNGTVHIFLSILRKSLESSWGVIVNFPELLGTASADVPNDTNINVSCLKTVKQATGFYVGYLYYDRLGSHINIKRGKSQIRDRRFSGGICILLISEKQHLTLPYVILLQIYVRFLC